MVFERPRATQRPTPTPRPTLTPRAIVHVPPHATPAPVPQVAGHRAAGLRTSRSNGGARAKPIHHRYHFEVYEQLAKSRLGRAVGVAGTGAGAGVGPGAGGGQQGVGAGSGTGQSGAGNGAVNANTPCGDVVFNVRGAPEYQAGAASEKVTATVAFPDGHTETDTFPYRWNYANGERDDPWSSTNLAKQDVDVPLIFPPPGTDMTGFSPLIRYILDHTRPDGTTVLAPCGNQTPLPTHE